MSSEKIFEYDLDITAVTDYGANMETLFTGRESVPLQGAQGAVRNVVGIGCGVFPGNMKVSFQAARSIG
jgi:hypothetical protein